MITSLLRPQNYLNIYSADCKDACLSLDAQPNVCFGSFYAYLTRIAKEAKVTKDSEVTITLIMRDASDNNMNIFLGNNAMLLNKEDLNYYLNYINTYIMPFKYVVSSLPNINKTLLAQRITAIQNKDTFVTLTVTFKVGTPKHESLFLLSLLRNLFEFPFNISLYDAIKIKRSGKAGKLNLFELSHLLSTITTFSKYMNADQYFCASKYLKLITLNKIKTALINHSTVNSVFEAISTNLEIMPTNIKTHVNNWIDLDKDANTYNCSTIYSLYFNTALVEDHTKNLNMGLFFNPEWKTRYEKLYKENIETLLKLKRVNNKKQ